MIIKANHNFLVFLFFRFYSRWIIRKHFGVIEVESKFREGNLPVLLIANHFSWWDGFIPFYWNNYYLKRKFHFMMLEEQLKKFAFFKRLGGFSVRKNNRSILESVEYAAQLLRDKRNAVLVFPQGRIETSYKTAFNFESGIAKIIRKATLPIQILFMANLVDYFSERKPGLFIYIREYSGEKFDIESIQEAYNLFFSQCISANELKSKD